MMDTDIELSLSLTPVSVQPMPKLTLRESETIIRRCADQKHWDIYSAIPRDITRIRKMVQAFGGQLTESTDGDVRAVVPTRALTFRQSSGNVNSASFTTAERAVEEDKPDDA